MADRTPFSLKAAELRHLRAFVAVARTGNVSRAAELVGLTQPRVSQQLKELEEAVDTALFSRIGRRLSLTAAGRRLYTDAVEILDRLELAMRTLTDAPGGEETHLRIGVVPAFGPRFIPAILGILARRHPRWTLEIDELSGGDVERDVAAGRLDLGLGFLPPASPSLEYEPLLKERFRLIVRADHPLATEPGVRAAALRELSFTFLPQRYTMRQLIDQQLGKNQVRPRVQYELSSVPALIRTVQEAGLATLLPPFAVPPSPDIVDIELLGRYPAIDVGLVRPRTEGRNLAVAGFADAAIEVVRTTALRHAGD